MRLFIADYARRSGIGEDDIAKIELAVDEACTNIIKHAYRFEPDRQILINVSVAKANEETKKFVVRITDHGTPFDATQYHDPDMAEYFKSFRVGGLGIILMKKLMDEVSYDTKPGKPNQVTLVKYFSPH